MNKLSVWLEATAQKLPPQTPAFLLRLGLAFCFAFAAVSGFIHPDDWVGYLPSFVTGIVDAYTALHIFGVLEIALALWLLAGWQQRLAGLAAAGMLAGITLTNLGLLLVTFRDVSLTLAALALAALPTPKSRP